ncbi:MAG: phage baseplate assembly protein V [Candidatus Methanomethylicaceae archaeon]
MPFQIVSKEVNSLLRRQYTTHVTIDRKIYDHSTAQIVLDWDDELREGVRSGRRDIMPTSELGAALLNSDVLIRWCSPDLAKTVDCFRGYIHHVSTRQTSTRSYIVLDCVAYTKRTDLVPRYRVWQECSLGEVCQHLSQRDSLIQVLPDIQRTLSQSPINLTLQYGETDFSYLRRMLRAWGVPLATDDMEGKLIIGNPQFTPKDLPQQSWHWKNIGFSGSVSTAFEKGRASGGGPFGIAKQLANRFSRTLSRIASNYTAQVDQKNQAELMQLTANLQDTTFHSSAGYTMEWQGGVFDIRPGSIMPVGNQSLYVQGVKIVGHPFEDIVSQVLDLNDQMMPVHPPEEQPRWPMRVLLGRVVRNDDGDPTQSGRVQVEFDWESLDPTSVGANRAWLPLATPYGGVAGGAAAGFLSLPEVGEHVLVQFLGDWDSQAVVIGVIRDAPCTAFKYDPHETKRWQTPSGNQITLTTLTGGDTDIVRIKCRDKLVLEAKLEPGMEKVIVDVFDSEADRIHYEKKGGKAQLDIFCSGDIYMHADKKFYLEAAEIQMTSTQGNVQIQSAKNIAVQGRLIGVQGASRIHLDAPQLKFNCGQPKQKHWKLVPLIPASSAVPISASAAGALDGLAGKLVDGVKNIGSTLLDSVSNIANRLLAPGSPLSQPLQKRLDKLGRKFPHLKGVVAGAWGDLAKSISEGRFSDLAKTVAQLGATAGMAVGKDLMGRWAAKAGSWVGKRNAYLGETVKGFFDQVGPVAGSLLGEVIGRVASPLTGALGGAIGQLGRIFHLAQSPRETPAPATLPSQRLLLDTEPSISADANPYLIPVGGGDISYSLPSSTSLAHSLIGADHPCRRNDYLLDDPRVDPAARERFKNVLEALRAQGYPAYVIEVYRDPQRQRFLYAQGRTDEELIAAGFSIEEIRKYRAAGATPNQGKVTWTLNSKHMTGKAMDVGYLPHRGANPYNAPNDFWRAYGEAARKAGLEWGGKWSNPDRPHVEMK